MLQDFAIGRSATPLDSEATLCAVVETSMSSWLVAGLLPGVEQRPLKKMSPDKVGLFAVIERWCAEAADTGVGLETVDMLTQEIKLRDLRDQRAVARYAGLTGSPHDSGARRRERGLSRAGNAQVHRGMVQLA